MALCEWLVWRILSKGGTLFIHLFACGQPCSWAYSWSTSVECSCCVRHADGMLINIFILCSPPCFVVLFQLMPDWWLNRKVKWCESTVRGELGVHRVCIRPWLIEGGPPPGSPLCFGKQRWRKEKHLLCSQAWWELSPSSDLYSCATSEKSLHLSEEWDSTTASSDGHLIIDF